MTIPEQLQVSVLAAPLAAVDRRALSQAWYSALYRQSKRPIRLSATSSFARPPRANVAPRLRSRATVRRIVMRPRDAGGVTKRESRRLPLTAVHDRRNVPAKIARQIETASGRTEKQTHSATFSLGKQGRVHVVLQQSGSRVRLIALCARGMGATVSRALEEARYALASRGVRLENRTL